jgi:hypothetical protein
MRVAMISIGSERRTDKLQGHQPGSPLLLLFLAFNVW